MRPLASVLLPALIALIALGCDPGTTTPNDTFVDDPDGGSMCTDGVCTNGGPGQEPTQRLACVLQADTTGMQDATNALLDAFDCSVENGYPPVRVPRGTYALSGTVVIPEGVSIVGEAEGSFGVNGPPIYDSLPMFQFATGMTDHGFMLRAGVSLTGVQVRAKSQSGNGKAVLFINGPNVEIRNVKITDGHWGIYAAGVVDVRGVVISDVFMVAPAAGVYIGRASGHSLVENVHVWNLTSGLRPATAFVFRELDHLDASLLSAFKYDTAIEFDGTTATVVGFQGDLCGKGIVTTGTSNVSVVGAVAISHFTSLLVDGSSNVSATGSHFSSNGAAAVSVQSPNAVMTLTGNTIMRTSTAHDKPGVSVSSARRVTITGNTIWAHHAGIVFSSSPAHASSIFGNTVDVSP